MKLKCCASHRKKMVRFESTKSTCAVSLDTISYNILTISFFFYFKPRIFIFVNLEEKNYFRYKMCIYGINEEKKNVKHYSQVV